MLLVPLHKPSPTDSPWCSARPNGLQWHSSYAAQINTQAQLRRYARARWQIPPMPALPLGVAPDHLAIGVANPVEAPADLGKRFEPGEAIVVGQKNVPARIAARRDVIKRAGELEQ